VSYDFRGQEGRVVGAEEQSDEMVVQRHLYREIFVNIQSPLRIEGRQIPREKGRSGHTRKRTSGSCIHIPNANLKTNIHLGYARMQVAD
jgi:hypothetical protein